MVNGQYDFKRNYATYIRVNGKPRPNNFCCCSHPNMRKKLLGLEVGWPYLEEFLTF